MKEIMEMLLDTSIPMTKVVARFNEIVDEKVRAGEYAARAKA